MLQELQQNEALLKEAILDNESRIAKLEASLQHLTTAEETARATHDEMQRMAKDAEAAHAKREKELSEESSRAEKELAELNGQLLPLRDWKTTMDELQARLAALPSDSLEARNVRNEIEMAMATLRYLLSNAGASRARAQLAMSRPRPTAQETEQIEAQSSPSTNSASEGGSSQDTISLNSKLRQLRETVQREEARIEFLNQERERLEQQGRIQRTGDPALRDKNRKLEDQIRLNETRLAMLEDRLQKGQQQENRHRETMATLAQQLNELRLSLSNTASAAHSQPRTAE